MYINIIKDLCTQSLECILRESIQSSLQARACHQETIANIKKALPKSGSFAKEPYKKRDISSVVLRLLSKKTKKVETVMCFRL